MEHQDQKCQTPLLITELFVRGLDCPEEAKLIENRLRGIPGIQSISPNFLQGSVKITHGPEVDRSRITTEILATGLSVIENAPGAETDAADYLKKRLIRVLLSGLFLGTGMLISYLETAPSFQLSLFVSAILIGGSLVAPKALKAIRIRTLDMNILMVIAVLGAAAIGEWAEGAAVTFLFSLSEYLESFSVARARRAIDALLKLAPQTAFVRSDGNYIEKPVSEILIKDIVQVRPGARVPTDGTVRSGSSSVNQAPITGESLPISKRPGDEVYAGTINGEGTLEIEVGRLSSESTIAGIVRLIQDAQGQRAPAQTFVDRFAAIYTPSVFVLSFAVLVGGPILIGGDWSTWLYRALVLLVIACPCSLVISTPVSIVSGLTAMAKHGVLVKGGAYLEALGKIRALAVDKTGTITEGKPEVTGVFSLNGYSEEEIVRIAASLDACSDHPLALAVIRYAECKRIAFPEGKDLCAEPGMGVRGSIEGHDYFLGNHHFVEKLGVCSAELEERLAELEYEAKSVIVVGHAPHGAGDEEVLGVIAVADRIRPEAKVAIAKIHRSGVEKIVMLSGDNPRTAQVIASEVGIDDARGNLLPADKIAAIHELMKTFGSVAMIGDGVNDAPAMAASTIGIAMGGIGTDTAIETADVSLMNDNLSKVAEAISMGRRTLGIIQFNIAFSLIVKFTFLALALAGHSSLWMAILADTGATILVILNALRLLRTSAKLP